MRTRAEYPCERENLGSIDIEELSLPENRSCSAYDLAILLKPSKRELNLDFTGKDISSADFASAGPAVVEEQQNLLENARQGWYPYKPRLMIIHRILETGLRVMCLLSLDQKQLLLKVRAPPYLLEIGAEQLRMRKLRKFDETWMEFSIVLRDTFSDYNSVTDEIFFSGTEKQLIVHAFLTWGASLRGAGLQDMSLLKSKYISITFPLHRHKELMWVKSKWAPFKRSYKDVVLKSSRTEIMKKITNDHFCTTRDASAPFPIIALLTRCMQRTPLRGIAVIKRVFDQPIYEVSDYFGENIAFHFAWLEMYTRWLIPPSLAGLALFVLQLKSNSLDHPLAPFYAIFLACWASAFLIAWKRRAITLAYKWGSIGCEDAEIERPGFERDRNALWRWKRLLKYCITIPIVFICDVLILIITCWGFAVRDQFEAKFVEEKNRAMDITFAIKKSWQSGHLSWDSFVDLRNIQIGWSFWLCFVGSPIFYGILVPSLDFIFTKLARIMTVWEDHATETHFQSHLIVKVFAFRFIHVFAAMYYYAFATSTTKLPQSSFNQSADQLLISESYSRFLRLSMQLASLMIVGQLGKILVSVIHPNMTRNWHQRQAKQLMDHQLQHLPLFSTADKPRVYFRASSLDANVLDNNDDQRHKHKDMEFTPGSIAQSQCTRLEQASDKAWEEAKLEPHDTFQDYTDLLIQFGYVTFFSIAFPLAPFLALCNNLFKIRVDAYNLCNVKQKPLAHKASDVGVWLPVLQAMSVLAILTNSLHIFYTTSQVEKWFPVLKQHTELRIWSVFVTEHLLLALKVSAIMMIPSIPRQIQMKLELERERKTRMSARAIAADASFAHSEGIGHSRNID